MVCGWIRPSKPFVSRCGESDKRGLPCVRPVRFQESRVIEYGNAWSAVAKKTQAGNRDSGIHGVFELTNGQASSFGDIALQRMLIVTSQTTTELILGAIFPLMLDPVVVKLLVYCTHRGVEMTLPRAL
jgi:hypothetical protein